MGGPVEIIYFGHTVRVISCLFLLLYPCCPFPLLLSPFHPLSLCLCLAPCPALPPEMPDASPPAAGVCCCRRYNLWLLAARPSAYSYPVEEGREKLVRKNILIIQLSFSLSLLHTDTHTHTPNLVCPTLSFLHSNPLSDYKED